MFRAFNTISELPRAVFEYASFAQTKEYLTAMMPKGNGRPVLVLPGFGTGDKYLGSFRSFLQEMGYSAYAWEAGRNIGFSPEIIDQIAKRLREVYEQNGRQKVSLVGHSLGGVFARELAREFPEMVRDVVTLGSPFGMKEGGGGIVTQFLKAVHDKINPHGSALLLKEDMTDRFLTPPPVPTTSVFSLQDGIVKWEDGVNPVAKNVENVQIVSSHAAMPWNKAALVALLDRLAQPEGQWKPFDKTKYRDIFFPSTIRSKDCPQNPKWTGTDKIFCP